MFPLFQTHYHQITITKAKEIKFEPRIKLNYNTYTSACFMKPVESQKSVAFYFTSADVKVELNHVSETKLVDYQFSKASSILRSDLKKQEKSYL